MSAYTPDGRGTSPAPVPAGTGLPRVKPASEWPAAMHDADQATAEDEASPARWDGAPSPPDYFRNMIIQDPCTYAEFLARLM
ncbi:hypothetical protein [Nitrospirillum sp. BR 11163]|uniref:hypothetical protein n=1 Tax=Nitrospirillum sp. BR 11163 TaxID=3104323 RepID=UPI002AFE6F71|nr:hypothetical protein [Nitrospirillum sp. BR 11163]MEA1675385.1 hypothetical protein [Nitrospirillum sp. BR 11163]